MISQERQANRWLAHKYLLFSVGIYTTIAGITGISYLCMRMGLAMWPSMFIAFLLTVFARTFYEQLVILDIPRTYLVPEKNALFALIYATIMSFIFSIIRARLGYWGIPISFIIAQTVIKPIKNRLWPAKPRPELYELYAAKQNRFMPNLYGFYGLLALIAVIGVRNLHLNFVVAFGAAVFIALVVSIFSELYYLFDQKIVFSTIIQWVLVALALAIITTTAVVGAITLLHVPGQAATITVCIAVKILEQYLLIRSL